MAGEVGLLVQDLFQALKGSGGVLGIEGAVQGICTLAAGVETADDGADFARQLCAACFGTPGKDVLAFIRESSMAARGAKDPITRARASLLHFTANVMLITGAAVLPHLPAIRDACLFVIKADTASETVTAALGPLSRMAAGKLLSAAAFRPGDVLDALVRAWEDAKHPIHKQNSPRGAAAALMGLVVQAYPSSFTAEKVHSSVYSRLMQAIRNMWRGDAAVAAGGVSASSFAEDEEDPGFDFVEGGEDATDAPPPASSSFAASRGSAGAASRSSKAGSSGAGGMGGVALAEKPALIAGCLAGINHLLRGHPEVLHASDVSAGLISATGDDGDPGANAVALFTAEGGAAAGTASGGGKKPSLMKLTMSYSSTELYFYVKRSVCFAHSRPGRHLSMDLPEAGHALLLRHAELLQKHIVADAHSLFDVLLVTCHWHGRKRVRALAQPTLAAVMQVVARALATAAAHVAAAPTTGAAAASAATAAAALRGEFRWYVVDRFMRMLHGQPAFVKAWDYLASREFSVGDAAADDDGIGADEDDPAETLPATAKMIRLATSATEALASGTVAPSDRSAVASVAEDEKQARAMMPTGVTYNIGTDLQLAVKGLALFGGPMLLFMGAWETRAVALALLDRIRTMLDREMEGVDPDREDELEAHEGQMAAADKAAGDMMASGADTAPLEDASRAGPSASVTGGAAASSEVSSNTYPSYATMIQSGRRVRMLSATLVAIASILQLLPAQCINHDVLLPLRTCAEELVTAWSGLAGGARAGGGREDICRALHALFVALYGVRNRQVAPPSPILAPKAAAATASMDADAGDGEVEVEEDDDRDDGSGTAGGLPGRRIRGPSGPLRDFIAALVPPMLLRTLSRDFRAGSPGSAAPALVHPVSGETESRLLFEYAPLWRELLGPHDAATVKALQSLIAAAARDLVVVDAPPAAPKPAAAARRGGGGKRAAADRTAAASGDVAAGSVPGGGPSYALDIAGLGYDASAADDADLAGEALAAAAAASGSGDDVAAPAAAPSSSPAAVLLEVPRLHAVVTARIRTLVFSSLMAAVVETLETCDLSLVAGASVSDAVGASSGEGDEDDVTRASVLQGSSSLLALSLSQDPASAAAGAVVDAGHAGDAATGEAVAALAALSSAVGPANREDFDRFLCLVDFLRYTLPLLPAQQLQSLLPPWLLPVVRACVHGAARAPHASGFYVVLTACMAVVEDGRLFSHCLAGAHHAAAIDGSDDGDAGSVASFDDADDGASSVSSAGSSLSLASTGSVELAAARAADLQRVHMRTAFQLLHAFASETAHRCRQYKGELLLAALQFLLLAPRELITVAPPRTIGALEAALRVGASSPPVAALAIFSLARLHAQFRDLVSPHYARLLPHLASLLEIGDARGEEEGGAAVVSSAEGGADDDNDDGDGTAWTTVKDPTATSEAGRKTYGNEAAALATSGTADHLRMKPQEAVTSKLLAAVAFSPSATDDDGAGSEAASVSPLLMYSSQLLSTMAALSPSDDTAFASENAGNSAGVLLPSAAGDGVSALLASAATSTATGRVIFRYLSLCDQEVSSASLRQRLVALLTRLGAAAEHIVGDARQHLQDEVAWGRALKVYLAGGAGALTSAIVVDAGAVTGVDDRSNTTVTAALSIRLPGANVNSTAGAAGGSGRSAGAASASSGRDAGGDLRMPLSFVLPRTVQLATTAASRQTKVAACELLHAIVLKVVGEMFSGSNVSGASSSVLTPVFSLLFPTCLRLAVDAEPIAKQLFVPLSLQIVRLFADVNQASRSDEVAIVMDGIVEASGNEDAGLRDFGARCFGDFVRWGIKTRMGDGAAGDGRGGDAVPRGYTLSQPSGVEARGETTMPATGQGGSAADSSLVKSEHSSKSRGKAGALSRSTAAASAGAASSAAAADSIASRSASAVPLLIEQLMRRMFAALRHASPSIRLGGCLAWSNCYRDVRERDPLVSVFTLALLDHSLHALRAAAGDPSTALGTADAAAAAVDHCERIIAYRMHLLSAPDASRPRSSPADMAALLLWLFARCGLRETQARRRCMTLFDRFAPLFLRSQSKQSAVDARKADGGSSAKALAARHMRAAAVESASSPSRSAPSAGTAGAADGEIDDRQRVALVRQWIEQLCTSAASDVGPRVGRAMSDDADADADALDEDTALSSDARDGLPQVLASILAAPVSRPTPGVRSQLATVGSSLRLLADWHLCEWLQQAPSAIRPTELVSAHVAADGSCVLSTTGDLPSSQPSILPTQLATQWDDNGSVVSDAGDADADPSATVPVSSLASGSRAASIVGADVRLPTYAQHVDYCAKLAAALDVYTWVLGRGYATADELFPAATVVSSSATAPAAASAGSRGGVKRSRTGTAATAASAALPAAAASAPHALLRSFVRHFVLNMLLPAHARCLLVPEAASSSPTGAGAGAPLAALIADADSLTLEQEAGLRRQRATVLCRVFALVAALADAGKQSTTTPDQLLASALGVEVSQLLCTAYVAVADPWLCCIEDGDMAGISEWSGAGKYVPLTASTMLRQLLASVAPSADAAADVSGSGAGSAAQAAWRQQVRDAVQALAASIGRLSSPSGEISADGDGVTGGAAAPTAKRKPRAASTKTAARNSRSKRAAVADDAAPSATASVSSSTLLDVRHLPALVLAASLPAGMARDALKSAIDSSAAALLTSARVGTLCSAARMLHECHMLQPLLEACAALGATVAAPAPADVTVAGSAHALCSGLASSLSLLTKPRLLAAAVGTAVAHLQWTVDQRPELRGCASALLHLALDFGWSWESPLAASTKAAAAGAAFSSRSKKPAVVAAPSGGSEAALLQGLRACLALDDDASGDSATASRRTSIARARAFYARFRLPLLRHMQRPEIFVAPEVLDQRTGGRAGAVAADDDEAMLRGSKGSAGTDGSSDPRAFPTSYPVMRALANALLASTAAALAATKAAASAAASASKPSPSAPSTTSATASDLRVHAWGIISDITRTLGRAARGGLSVSAGGSERIDMALDSFAGEAADKPRESNAHAKPAVTAAVDATPASTVRMTRVAGAVFVNALLSAIGQLRPWVSSAAPDECAFAVVQLVRWAASIDPWLLVAVEPPAAGAGASFGRQLRVLPPAATNTITALLARLQSSNEPHGSPARTMCTLALRSSFFALLPCLVPGSSFKSPMPAAMVDPAALGLETQQASAPAASSRGGHVAHGAGGKRQLSPLYAQALHRTSQIVQATFPVNSLELLLRGKSKQRAAYANALRGLLGAFAATGSLVLLRMLHRVFREGDTALLHADVTGALTAFAATIAPEGDSPLAVMREVLAIMFTPPTDAYRATLGGASSTDGGSSALAAALGGAGIALLESCSLLRAICDCIAVPLLQRLAQRDRHCRGLMSRILLDADFFASVKQAAAALSGSADATSSSVLAYPCRKGVMKAAPPSSLLQYLLNAVTNTGAFTDDAPDVYRCTRLSSAYLLLACVFEGLDAEGVRGRLYPHFRDAVAAATGEAVKDNALNVELVKAGRTIMAGTSRPRVGDAETPTQYASDTLRLRQAVFMCSAASARKMQSEAKNFHMMVWKDLPPSGVRILPSITVPSPYPGADSSASVASAGGSALVLPSSIPGVNLYDDVPYFAEAVLFFQSINVRLDTIHAVSPACEMRQERYLLRSVVGEEDEEELGAPTAGRPTAVGRSLSAAGSLSQAYAAARHQRFESQMMADSDDAGFSTGSAGAGSRRGGPTAAAASSLSLSQLQGEGDLAATSVRSRPSSAAGASGLRAVRSTSQAGSLIASLSNSLARSDSGTGGTDAAGAASAASASAAGAATANPLASLQRPPTKEELELSPFNRSPVMIAILRSIDHAVVTFKSPPMSTGKVWPRETGYPFPHLGATGPPVDVLLPPDPFLLEDAPMPDWMEVLYRDARDGPGMAEIVHESDMGSTSDTGPFTPLVTRLFICRIILNRPLLFKPWHKKWTPVLLKTLLELQYAAKLQQKVNRERQGKADAIPDCMSSPTAAHHFLRDVCMLLTVTWASDVPRDIDSDDVWQPWAPRNARQGKLASAFLTYLVTVTPSRKRRLWLMWLGFLRSLILRWCPPNLPVVPPAATGMVSAAAAAVPAGPPPLTAPGVVVRPAFKEIYGLLVTKDDKSKSALSYEGMKVATAVETIKALIQAGAPAAMEADFATSGGQLSLSGFYTQICALMKGDKRLPSVLYPRVAQMCGDIIAQATSDARFNAKTAGASILQPELAAALVEIARVGDIQSGAVTSERGNEKFLLCVTAAAESHHAIVTTDVFYRVAQALDVVRGRLIGRARMLESVLRSLTSCVRGGMVPVEDVWERVRSHVPNLLQAQTAGRKTSDSVQYLALRFVSALLDKWTTLQHFASLMQPGAAWSLPRLFSAHPSLAVRGLYYDMLQRVWERLEKGEGADLDTAAGGAAGAAVAGGGMEELDAIDDGDDGDEDAYMGSGGGSAAGGGASSPSESASNAPLTRAGLQRVVRVGLLNGLLQNDPRLRETIFAFFDDPSRLSGAFGDRLHQVMHQMFDPAPAAARPWLHYAAPLLFRLCARASGFDDRTAIFPSIPFRIAGEAPSFRKQLVGGASASGYTSLTAVNGMRPLFAGALSQAAAGPALMSTALRQKPGIALGQFVRASMPAAFSLTQDDATAAAAADRRDTLETRRARVLQSSLAPFHPYFQKAFKSHTTGNVTANRGPPSLWAASQLGNLAAAAIAGGGNAGFGSIAVTYAVAQVTGTLDPGASLASQAFYGAPAAAAAAAGAAASSSGHPAPATAAGRQPLLSATADPSVLAALQLIPPAAAADPSVAGPAADTPEAAAGARARQLLEVYMAERGPPAPSAPAFATSPHHVIIGMKYADQDSVGTLAVPDWNDRKRNEQQQKLADAARRRSTQRASAKVARDYRLGELPDVQLSAQSFIEPLQTLCQLDAAVAHTAFATVFAAAYARAPSSKTAHARMSAAAGGGGRGRAAEAAAVVDRVQLRKDVQSMLLAVRGVGDASSSAAVAASGAGAVNAGLSALPSVVNLLLSLVAHAESVEMLHSNVTQKPADVLQIADATTLGNVGSASMTYASSIARLESALLHLNPLAGTEPLRPPPDALVDAASGGDSSGVPPSLVRSLLPPDSYDPIPRTAGTARFDEVPAREASSGLLTGYKPARAPVSDPATPADITAAWAQLSELYSSLGEEDVAVAITENHGGEASAAGSGAAVGGVTAALRALRLETAGRYQEACEAYNGVLAGWYNVVAAGGAKSGADDDDAVMRSAGAASSAAASGAAGRKKPTMTAAQLPSSQDSMDSLSGGRGRGKLVPAASATSPAEGQYIVFSAVEEDEKLAAVDASEVAAWDASRTRDWALLRRWGHVEAAVAHFAVANKPIGAIAWSRPGAAPTDYRCYVPGADVAAEADHVDEVALAATDLTPSVFRGLDTTRAVALLRSWVRLEGADAAGELAAKDKLTGEDSAAFRRDYGAKVRTALLSGGPTAPSAAAGRGALAALRMSTLLAQHHLTDGSFDSALTTANAGIAQVPTLFGSFPSLAAAARLRVLSAAQPLVELQEGMKPARALQAAVAVAKKAGAAALDATITTTLLRLPLLMQAWRTRAGGALMSVPTGDAMDTWDELVAGRKLLEGVVNASVDALDAAARRRATTAASSSASSFLVGPLLDAMATARTLITPLSRASYAHAAVDARRRGELTLARAYMDACLEVSRVANQPRSAAQVGLQVSHFGHAYVLRELAKSRAAGAGSVPASIDVALKSLRMIIKTTAEYSAQLQDPGKVSTLEAAVEPLATAASGLVLPSGSRTMVVESRDVVDAALLTYAFDLQSCRGHANAALISQALDADSPLVPALVAAPAEVSAALTTALSCLRGCADGVLIDAVYGVGDGSGTAQQRVPSTGTTVAGALVSPHRTDASRRAVACMQFASFARALLEHWEEAGASSAITQALQASTSLSDAPKPATGRAAAVAAAGLTRGALAAVVVRNVVSALAIDPAAEAVAAAAPGLSGRLSAVSAATALHRAQTGVLDDCTLPDPFGAQAASLQRGAAVIALPSLLELASRYGEARAAFVRTLGLEADVVAPVAASSDSTAAAAATAAMSVSRPVPIHAFLPWTAQLMATAQPARPGSAPAKPASAAAGAASRSSTAAAADAPADVRSVALALLVRMARKYPQAVYYPFRISNTRSPDQIAADAAEGSAASSAGAAATGRAASVAAATSAAAADGAVFNRLLASLRHALRLPLLGAFVRAMEDLHTPEMKFQDWVKAVEQMIRTVRNTTRSATAELPPAVGRALYADMMARCFGRREELGPHFDQSVGVLVKAWIKRWQPLVTKKLGDGATVTHAALQAVKAGSGGDTAPTVTPPGAAMPTRLSDLSGWLASFNAGDASGVIEIPGQYDRYDGTAAPDPSTHLHVVSCDAAIRTMESMRQPKRITFLAQDERSHRFLVKGGEDIRADQRVEQLFSAVNRILAAGATTRRRKLEVRTYAVTPMTPFIGVLQWVDQTLPIKLAVEQIANERLTAAASMMAAPGASAHGGKKLAPGSWQIRSNVSQALHQQFIRSFEPPAAAGQQVAWLECHKNMNATATLAQVHEMWERMMRHMPVDMLRAYIVGLTTSPEGMMAVRQRFVQSFATFSIVGYLLQIGDRHLDNFLLDCSDGSVVPIDFGAVFGYATSLLPVPEMLPFRLTPQFLAIMQPVSTWSILKTYMTDVMTALASDTGKRTALPIMSVFVTEPTLDWQAQAKRTGAYTQQKGKAVSAAGRKGGAGAASGAGVEDDDGETDLLTEELEAASGTEAAAVAWFARAKLLLAQLKLEGANPGPLLFADMLQNNHYAPGASASRRKKAAVNEPLLKHVLETLTGSHSPAIHVRARPENSRPVVLKRSQATLLETAIGGPLAGNEAAGSSRYLDLQITACKDVAAQVDCLLDMATDPNVLVRQYAGLSTWI